MTTFVLWFLQNVHTFFLQWKAKQNDFFFRVSPKFTPTHIFAHQNSTSEWKEQHDTHLSIQKLPADLFESIVSNSKQNTKAVHSVMSAGQWNRKYSGPINLQRSHSFKVLFSALHTQFQSSSPRFKGILIVGWRRCTELWISCFCEVLNAGTFLPSQHFFDEGEQLIVTWSQVGTAGGFGQDLDVLLLSEVVADTTVLSMAT